MTEQFPWPTASRNLDDQPGDRTWDVPPPDFSTGPAGAPVPSVRHWREAPVSGAAPSPALPPEPALGPPGGGDVDPVAPLDTELRRKRSLRSRLRLGLAFAFVVSLLLHSTLLALFVGGTAPGLPDGQEGISVEVVTQEQLDILLGNGSSQGGKPPKVDDAGNGTAPSLQTPGPPMPRKAETESEQKEALNIITSTDSPEQMPRGNAERENAAAAATPRKAEKKSEAKGSLGDSIPSRRTDPKERPDSPREDARTEAAPVETNPGADGGAMRRVASRGGVGDQLGPLPPSMRQALMQQLQKQIEVCYEAPAGTPQQAELPLILIRLHRDGSLQGAPKSLRYERTAAGKGLVKAALKAVQACAPYRMPPRFAPYYEEWREIRAQFEFSGR